MNPKPIKRILFQPMLGDKVEALVKPFAKAVGAKCLDESGKLKPESGCAKRKAMLNKLMFPV
jgi:hypothetical protein